MADAQGVEAEALRIRAGVELPLALDVVCLRAPEEDHGREAVALEKDRPAALRIVRVCDSPSLPRGDCAHEPSSAA